VGQGRCPTRQNLKFKANYKRRKKRENPLVRGTTRKVLTCKKKKNRLTEETYCKAKLKKTSYKKQNTKRGPTEA